VNIETIRTTGSPGSVRSRAAGWASRAGKDRAADAIAHLRYGLVAHATIVIHPTFATAGDR
jgi:hypothetical protein